jgi:hypothetical protein
MAIPQRAPKGAILASELILLYEGKEATAEQVRYHLERTLSLVEMYVGAVNMDLFDYNENLDRVSRRKIQERRNRLMQARETANFLGYPLREDGINNALSELASSEEVPSEKTPRRTIAAEAVGWDVFICHASEDKEEIAEPLASTLRSHGLRVWLDKFVLRLGDSIRRTIDRGLSSSRFGVVIISPNFFQKEWPQRELDGLAARELGTERVILPVWHRVDYEYVLRYSPILADRFAVMTSQGLDSIAREILQVVNANCDNCEDA